MDKMSVVDEDDVPSGCGTHRDDLSDIRSILESSSQLTDEQKRPLFWALRKAEEWRPPRFGYPRYNPPRVDGKEATITLDDVEDL